MRDEIRAYLLRKLYEHHLAIDTFVVPWRMSRVSVVLLRYVHVREAAAD